VKIVDNRNYFDTHEPLQVGAAGTITRWTYIARLIAHAHVRRSLHGEPKREVLYRSQLPPLLAYVRISLPREISSIGNECTENGSLFLRCRLAPYKNAGKRLPITGNYQSDIARYRVCRNFCRLRTKALRVYTRMIPERKARKIFSINYVIRCTYLVNCGLN